MGTAILACLLPRLPYMTRMDYFLLASTVLVFLALMEVVLTTFLAHHKRAPLARKVDRLARLAFPAAFLFVFAIGGSAQIVDRHRWLLVTAVKFW